MFNTMLASAQYSGSGNGTEDDPYLIYNETQLYQMNNFLGSDNAGVVFKLMKDLDLSEFISDNFPSEGWIPVGVESTPFQGKFCGNNHTLSGLWINRTSTNNVGFFGYVSGATIKDLSIKSTFVFGASHVGTLIGYATGTTISNCHVTGTGSETVKGAYVGGVAGYILGATSITNSDFEGVCVKSNSANSYAGGFVGYASSSTLSNCDATTKVAANMYTGGIIGQANAMTLSGCDAKGNITATSNTGGICGHMQETSTLTNCKYEGDISANTNVAGVAGTLAEGACVTFSNSHSKGYIKNQGDYTGGIVGISNGGCIAAMENCSHFGEIKGNNYIGGLIGAVDKNTKRPTLHIYYGSTSASSNTHSLGPYYDTMEQSSSSMNIINNCTSVGNIHGLSYLGGLIGQDNFANGYTSEFVYHQTSYYDGYIYTWDDDSNTGYSSVGYRTQYRAKDQDGNTIWPYRYTYANVRTIHYKETSVGLGISNCSHSGNLEGEMYIGGIAGYKEAGEISYCYSLSTSILGKTYVGGICGFALGVQAVSDVPEKNLSLISNVSINNLISASNDFVGRINGAHGNSCMAIGTLSTSKGNRALTTTKVIKKGVVQDVTDDLQNGNVMGKSLLRLKANYVAMGWNFDDNWDILETECFPYKKYQAAPPVIESNLVSQETEISGSSLNGGTVYFYYKNRDAVSTTCTGNAWKFTTENLQSGAPVQLFADVEGMTPSYLTSSTVGYPGSGTETEPYRIYTAEDLHGASNKGYYKLMNDIDLSAWINENSPTEGWVSIGRNSGELTYINGDGHKVTGLWINTTQDYTGLFSNFSAGVIKNLTVEVASGKKVKGGDYTGVLIGRNANGLLLNCTVKGDVEGTVHVGGVTGYSGNNTVNTVTYEGKVASSTENTYVGGFAGLSENDAITSVRTYPTISATGAGCYVGGAIGYLNGGTVTRSLAETVLTATGANDYVGGLIGYSKGEITKSQSSGIVTAYGDNSYTGGLVGFAYNPITNCYSTAKTTGTYYTAGICAYTFSTIDKCYARGDVYGSRYGAGVVAQLDGSASALTNSIAANNKLELTDQSSWGCRVIGGFKNGAAEPNTSNYALSTMQVSLNGVAQKKTDDAVEGIAKDESVFLTRQTYENLGWDFTKVWSIVEGEGYPIIAAAPKYTIKYTVDGVVYETVSYEEGESVIPLAEPTKDGYTFSGWSAIPSVMPADDIVVSGTFTKTPEKIITTDISEMTDILYSEEKNVKSGSQIVLPIYMKNSTDVTLFQTNVYLPKGFSFATKTNGKYAVSLAKDRLTDEDDNHVISANIQSDGSLLILCSSQDNYTFDGKEGLVATVTLDVASTAAEGQYLIKLNNQKIVKPDNSGTNIGTYQVVATVKNLTLGDVNDDGEIDGYDLVGISNLILGTNTDGLNRSAADVNQDTEVDGYDYVMEVNTILGSNSSSAKGSRNTDYSENALSSLVIEPVNVSIGGQTQMNIGIECNGDVFTLVQTDIEFPDGIEPMLKNGRVVVKLANECVGNGDNHSISCIKQSDGKYRVLIMSHDNTGFNGQDGQLFTVGIETVYGMSEGLYDITLSNTKLVRANNTGVNPADYHCILTCSAATGINNITGEETTGALFNLNGQRVSKHAQRGIYISNGKKTVKK